MTRRTCTKVVLWLACVSLWGTAPIAGAEKFPMTWSELQDSQLIVKGTVQQIRIEEERSPVERGFGNTDWAIYLTLQVDEVIKGRFSESELEVRCFRIKHRRSIFGYMSHNGHSRIPAVGAKVRAHLNKGGQGWHVAYPNGFTSPDAKDDESLRAGGGLPIAPEVSRLKSRRYTYGLPVEHWAVIGVGLLVLAIPVVVIFLVVRKRRRAKGA